MKKSFYKQSNQYYEDTIILKKYEQHNVTI